MNKILLACLFFISTLTFANEDILNIEKKLLEISPSQFSKTRVEPSLVDGYYQILSNNGAKVYTNKNVSTFFSGDLIIFDGNQLKNITHQENRVRNKKIIDDLDKKYHQALVHYPSMAEKKITSLYIFSDFTCPYCKKLHQNIDQFSKLGVEIYYIPFPRNTMEDTRAVKGLQKIICSKDKQLAFNEAFKDPKGYAFKSLKDNISCPEAIDILNLHNYADILGVAGTPTAFTENGSKISGFNSAESFAVELRKALDEESTWKKE